ncbi:hypothetical protein, partial [Salmonella enterica]|uniref:hypothetical protein n=1 Tax=Salmonella enterica TaxID=28901 RepID=UPI0020C38DD5
IEEVVACNTIGKFERFGDRDIAVVCDFCDGHLVWEDIESIPSVRGAIDASASPASTFSPATQLPQWQATAYSNSTREA